jgi:nucleoside 2-deoxyribosyltransferase
MDSTATQKQMYVLMPFRERLDPVYDMLDDVAGRFGYTCVRADKDVSVRELTEKIIQGIYNSDVVIADLSGSNPNVLYELGIANALSKECLMLCQQAPEELPFDTKHFAVQRYVNTPEGLQALKARLIQILSSPVRIDSPVNRALDAELRKSRVATYVLAGTVAGVLLSFPASMITATIGHSFVASWQPQRGVFRTIAEGAPFTFFGGGLFLGAWSLVANHFGWAFRRAPVVAAEILAGVAAGAIAFAIVFLLAVGTLGPEVALSLGVPWLLTWAVGGLAFGLSVDVQMTRLNPQPLAIHLLKAVLTFGVIFLLFVALVDGFKGRLFFPAYLQRYDTLDAVGDAVRASLWGIGMVGVHWWMRWRQRL